MSPLPRNCGINRLEGQLGFCQTGILARIAFGGLHFGEEPPLTGENGSGTVFFSSCTLKCNTCQNYQLSKACLGKELGTEELSSLFLQLEEVKALNLNLVTGTHYIPAILEALVEAKKKDFSLPVVWNSSGFENLEILEYLNSHINIYLPDLKTLDSELAIKLSARADYPLVITKALKAMTAAKKQKWQADQLREGVIVRHLVLPGHLSSTRKCLEWFADQLAGQALLSIMFQYIPLHKGQRLAAAKKTSLQEYETVLDWLEELGLEDGYCQELEESDTWLPDFTRINPFPKDCCKPVWHFSQGYI